MAEYRTEDGVTLSTGDAAYDYYSMKPGRIGRDGYSGWFDFEHDDGTVTLLNGERICTLEFAARRGFKGALQIVSLKAKLATAESARERENPYPAGTAGIADSRDEHDWTL